MSTIQDQAQAKLAQQSVDGLIMSLEVIEAKIADLRAAKKTDAIADHNTARIWIIEELESRFDSKMLDQAFESRSATDDRSYSEFLIDTIHNVRRSN